MKWFEGHAAREKKTAVRNAIAVMASDESVDARELAMLEQICNRVGLERAELDKLLENPSAVRFTVPDTREERVRQLLDLVFMMMADGEVEARELALCTDLAERMGFAKRVVPALLETIMAGIREGRARAQVFVEVGAYLGR
jgi:tellurite resistance protein